MRLKPVTAQSIACVTGICNFLGRLKVEVITLRSDLEGDCLNDHDFQAKLRGFVWLRDKGLAYNLKHPLRDELLAAYRAGIRSGGDPYEIAAACWNGYVRAIDCEKLVAAEVA